MPSFFRKVIRIKATDSPNVRLGLLQQAKGLVPTDEVVVRGVLTWAEYAFRRAVWDPVRQCVGLDAEWWEGADVLLFPPGWLNRAEDAARALGKRPRVAKGIGIDPAEGGDKTSMTAIDEWGVIEQVSKKTPDTSVIIGEAIAFMAKHGCPAGRVYFDAGGGGKQIADVVRAKGYRVKTVPFGSAPTVELRRRMTPMEERIDVREEQTAYVNRRAEMYHDASILLDPSIQVRPFGISEELVELRRQLAPLPKLYDGEGRIRMLPKDRRSENSKEKTLKELLGCSPDEADSFVLAVHAMLQKAPRAKAGIGG